MLDRHNLHDYQNTAVKHIIDNEKAGLFLDMGLGKTVSTLTAINTLINEELEINTVLVIAPKRVAENVWTSEIKKWRHLRHLTTSRIIGTPKQRLHALNTKANIYLIGRDNVAWLIGLYGGSMLPFDMLVLDESSSFKNHKSIRFKALKKVQPSFSRVLALTGTPSPNGLVDLWSQIYLLDRGERLGKFITHYKNTYFNKGYYGFSKPTIKEHGEKLIYKKISDICISMKAKDYLSLPPRINNYIEISFSKKLKKQYKDFEREQVLELIATAEEDGKNITAMNAAALSNKLLQFANGAVYDEERKVYEVHKLKLDAAEELVEAAQGKPVLIAYTYKHDLTRLLERLKKYNPRKLSKESDIDDWNAKKIPVMIMHPASGGHGLNLQTGGSIIIWFGQTWSLELYQQFNARLDRQGQKETTVINHLISKGTIDERVIKAIYGKAAKQDGLMAAIKSLMKQYKNG